MVQIAIEGAMDRWAMEGAMDQREINGAMDQGPIEGATDQVAIEGTMFLQAIYRGEIYRSGGHWMSDGCNKRRNWRSDGSGSKLWIGRSINFVALIFISKNGTIER